MPKRVRSPGEFCWINIITPDPAASKAFFTKVLGWEYGEIPGMGWSIKVGGSDIGGLFDLNSPQTPPGTKPVLGVMVKVESADATAEKIRLLGGKAQAPFDVGPPGRMAVCHDPAGANFDIWQPGASPGTDVDASLHGAPSWHETMTTDAARASKFYQDLFGWDKNVMTSAGFDYTVFTSGDARLAGMMPITPEMGPIPSHWGVYFTVNDTDAAAKTAAEAGATVFIPPRDIPTVGRFSGLISPQGIRFYVIKYSM